MNIQTKITLSIFTIILFMVGCQSDINQPNAPLTYNGIVVSESTPDFTRRNALARSTAANAQIEDNPPYGTVYGHENDPDNVYLSQGGELLRDGSWADQVYNETYKTTLFGNSKAEFDNLATVTITNPVDMYYLDGNGNWVQITSDTTVETIAVTTGLYGSGDIESGTICAIGSGGNNG